MSGLTPPWSLPTVHIVVVPKSMLLRAGARLCQSPESDAVTLVVGLMSAGPRSTTGRHRCVGPDLHWLRSVHPCRPRSTTSATAFPSRRWFGALSLGVPAWNWLEASIVVVCPVGRRSGRDVRAVPRSGFLCQWQSCSHLGPSHA